MGIAASDVVDMVFIQAEDMEIRNPLFERSLGPRATKVTH